MYENSIRVGRWIYLITFTSRTHANGKVHASALKSPPQHSYVVLLYCTLNCLNLVVRIWTVKRA